MCQIEIDNSYVHYCEQAGAELGQAQKKKTRTKPNLHQWIRAEQISGADKITGEKVLALASLASVNCRSRKHPHISQQQDAKQGRQEIFSTAK